MPRPNGCLDVPGPQHEIRARWRAQAERNVVVDARRFRCRRRRLTIDQAREIRAAMTDLSRTQREIATSYGVSPAVVSSIWRDETYREAA